MLYLSVVLVLNSRVNIHCQYIRAYIRMLKEAKVQVAKVSRTNVHAVQRDIEEKNGEERTRRFDTKVGFSYCIPI